MNRIEIKLLLMALTLQGVFSLLEVPTFARTNDNAKFYKIAIQKDGKKPSSTATITVTGRSGYHCNTLYPWKLAIMEGQREVRALEKRSAKKFTKERVVFAIKYPAGSKVSAVLKLSMCNDKQCIMEKASLTW